MSLMNVSAFGTAIGVGSPFGVKDPYQQYEQYEQYEQYKQYQQLQSQLQSQLAKMPGKRPRARGEPTLNDLNNNPIFSAPREALRDMWRAKFDTVWVSKKDLDAGPEENIFLFQELTGRCGFKVVARYAYCEASGQNVEVFKFEFE